MADKDNKILTGMMREQYLVEWVFLSILWVVSALCAYILCINLLLLPQLGPPYAPSLTVPPLEWLFLAIQHPFIWPAALATACALALVVGLTFYFSIMLPAKVDSIVRTELGRIGLTTKRALRRQYRTKINSKGLLTTRLLPRIAGSGEYGLVVLRASLPDVPAETLQGVAQRYFLVHDKSSLATVCSLDELHWKVTQLARALDEL
ncbi:MAG: hypothetical protein ACFFCO_04075 [Promethearchaeota archaeon]